LVHIDENDENMASTPMARLHIHGRIASVFKRLMAHTYYCSALERESSPATSAAPASHAPLQEAKRAYQRAPTQDGADSARPVALITPQRLITP
jgi:hypothetical protein